MKTESTLLINGAFALRQQRGLPVFATIETGIIPHSKEFIERYAILKHRGLNWQTGNGG